MSRLNLENKKFGLLLVMSISHIYNGEVFWHCLCDCGNKVIRRKRTITNKRTKVINCGCYTKVLAKERIKPLIGHNRKAYGESSKNRIIRTYKKGAIKRNLEWLITDEVVEKLFKQNCFYCGIEPNNKCLNNNTEFVYNGIDRVDNTKGYIATNIVSCCKICNRSKGNLSISNFNTWMDRIKEKRTK